MTLHLSLAQKLRAKVRELKTNPVLSPWSFIPVMEEAAARLDELELELEHELECKLAELRLNHPHHEVKERK